jgi:hypothetical protein
MAKDSKEIEEAKRQMGALLRMPSKPHEEMKVGKTKRSLGKVATKSTKAKKSHVR